MTFTITSSVTSQVVIAHLLRNTISFRHSGQFCRGGFPRIFRLNTAERITRKCISQIGPITGLPYHIKAHEESIEQVYRPLSGGLQKLKIKRS